MWLLRPPKSRARLHWLTYLVGTVALVFVALVQVAGEKTYPSNLLKISVLGDPAEPSLFSASAIGAATGVPGTPILPSTSDEHPDYVEEYLHGWPTPWLRRAIGYRYQERGGKTGSQWRPISMFIGRPRYDRLLPIDAYYVSWNATEAWPTSADAWELDFVGQLINLLVAAMIVALPMAATELWLRRRGGLWRLRIIDLLATFTLIAAGFGFWRWDQAKLEWERKICREAGVTSEYYGIAKTMHFNFVGPQWLERLVGNSHAIPILKRATHLHVADLTLHGVQLEKLRSLRHLRTASVGIRMNTKTRQIAELAVLPQLSSLAIVQDSFGALADTHVAGLQQLPKLSSLQLHFDARSRDVLRLRKLPQLRELELSSAKTTSAELHRLKREFAGVSITDWHSQSRHFFHDEQVLVDRLGERFVTQYKLTYDASELVLSRAPFSETSLGPIKRALPHVRKLQLQDLAIQPSAAPYLLKMAALEELRLDLEEIPDDFVAAAFQLPRLSKVVLARGGASASALLPLGELPELELHLEPNCHLTHAEIEKLREAFGNRFFRN